MSEQQKENESKIFDKIPQRRVNPANGLSRIRGTVMGFLYIAVAFALVWAEKHGYITFGLNFSYGLAAVFVIYGIFRLYRALIKKQ